MHFSISMDALNEWHIDITLPVVKYETKQSVAHPVVWEITSQKHFQLLCNTIWNKIWMQRERGGKNPWTDVKCCSEAYRFGGFSSAFVFIFLPGLIIIIDINDSSDGGSGSFVLMPLIWNPLLCIIFIYLFVYLWILDVSTTMHMLKRWAVLFRSHHFSFVYNWGIARYLKP